MKYLSGRALLIVTMLCLMLLAFVGCTVRAQEACTELLVPTTTSTSAVGTLSVTPRRYFFLIDKSGSLGQERTLDYVKKAVSSRVAGLKDNDRIVILAFDRDTWFIVKEMGLSQHHGYINCRLGKLFPAQTTKILPLLTEVKFEVSVLEGFPNVGFLITDGVPDDDSHQVDRLLKEISAKLQLKVVCTGQCYDERRMRDYAVASGGTLVHAFDYESLTRALSAQ